MPKSKWKKIKSAPDGQSVLLYNEEWDMTMGSIQVGVIFDGECQVESIPDFNPTHWHPLPEPPPSRS